MLFTQTALLSLAFNIAWTPILVNTPKPPFFKAPVNPFHDAGNGCARLWSVMHYLFDNFVHFLFQPGRGRDHHVPILHGRTEPADVRVALVSFA